MKTFIQWIKESTTAFFPIDELNSLIDELISGNKSVIHAIADLYEENGFAHFDIIRQVANNELFNVSQFFNMIFFDKEVHPVTKKLFAALLCSAYNNEKWRDSPYLFDNPEFIKFLSFVESNLESVGNFLTGGFGNTRNDLFHILAHINLMMKDFSLKSIEDVKSIIKISQDPIWHDLRREWVDYATSNLNVNYEDIYDRRYNELFLSSFVDSPLAVPAKRLAEIVGSEVITSIHEESFLGANLLQFEIYGKELKLYYSEGNHWIMLNHR